MKKILALFLAVLLVITAAFSPSAVSATTYGEDVDIDVGTGGGSTEPENPEIPEEFSFANEPNEKGVLGGYITQTSSTVTAESYAFSEFLGWFDKNGQLITTEKTVSKTANGYHGARFETKNLIADGGFESFTTGSKIYDHAIITKQPWSFHSGGTTGLLTTWGDLYADGAYKLNGNNSIKMSPPFQMATTDVTLQPNTEYFISFNYTYTIPRDDVFPTKVSYGIYYPDSASNTMLQLTIDSVGRSVPGSEYAPGEWIHKTFTFTTGDTIPEGTVFGYSYSAASSTTEGTAVQNKTTLYVDDIVVMPTDSNTVDITFNAKNNIAVVPQNGCNEKFAVKNKPYTFSIVAEPGLTPTVTVGGNTLTPDADGNYTFTPTANTEITVSCGSDDEGRPAYGKDYFGRDLTKYNPDVYLEKVWQGDTVYHETALFTKDKDTVKLLYPASEVISLRSYSLSTTFVKGVDYEITADGCIKRLEGSRIPVYSVSLTKTTQPTSNAFPLRTNQQEWLASIDDITYPLHAVAVTYKHTKTFDDGYQPAAPEVQNKALDGVLTKLKNGEQVNIVVYGDSISCGWCCSGLFNEKIYNPSNTATGFATGYNMAVAPYMPTWANMVIAYLNEQFPGQVNFKNLSLSGKAAQWGSQNIAARLALWTDDDGYIIKPDLLMVGFGVNDSAGDVGYTPYKSYMKAIVTNARNFIGNSEMEVLYYSPMMPNQLTTTWDRTELLAYEDALEEIAAADQNIGVAKLTSIYDEIIKSKAPEDYLNTYWNHGNDFTGRMYATTILHAMFGDTEVSAPELESKTSNTVTLKKVDGYEYSLDGINWQTSNVFSNLNSSTTYNFVCRTAETDTAFAGVTSAALTVTTDAPPASSAVAGNVNADPDGLVNIDDVVALAQIIAGWQGVQHNPDALDVNGDNDVTIDDVVLLAQYVAGWDVTLKMDAGADVDIDMSEQE